MNEQKQRKQKYLNYLKENLREQEENQPKSVREQC